MTADPFPTRRPAELERAAAERRWLVDGLWLEQAVGFVGGEPKCCKSYLALDIAVAVASGSPCLRSFAVERPGPVLCYPAEEAEAEVGRRLRGIAAAAGARFESLDIAVIDAPRLRLDSESDRRRLAGTVKAARPRLLILDPLVRLHRVDENSAAEIGPILGFLRELQRSFETAVMLVHHTRKSGARRQGQSLRGSGDIFAWGDSYLHLRRSGSRLLLLAEHRSAPPGDEMHIELAGDEEAPALRLANPRAATPPAARPSDEALVLQVLAEAGGPLPLRAIRKKAGRRNAAVGRALGRLAEDGRVASGPSGYRLAGAAGAG